MGKLSAISSYAGNGEDFPTAEDGTYLCALLEIQPGQKRKFQSEDMEDCLTFKFETLEAQDPDGQPYRFVKKTGVKYGHEKAALTILIDGMVGRGLTLGEYEDLKIEDLLARKYRVMVTEDESTQSPGKYYNNIVSVKPAKTEARQRGSRPAETIEANIESPFEDDETAAPGISRSPVAGSRRQGS